MLILLNRDLGPKDPASLLNMLILGPGKHAYPDEDIEAKEDIFDTAKAGLLSHLGWLDGVSCTSAHKHTHTHIYNNK